MEFLSHNSTSLVVAIVRAIESGWLTNDSFDEASREHHEPDRNPLSAVEVMTIVNAALINSGVADKTLLTLLPRPARGLNWGIITQLFPGPRVWLIPQRGESWDESKASFFQEQGDRVLRISVPRTASGYEIRTQLSTMGQAVFESVPEGARQVLGAILRERQNKIGPSSPTSENH